MLLRSLRLVLAPAIFFLLLPAVQAQNLPLAAAGKLTWGTAPTFPPFEYIENGKPTGFDVDMMAAIAAKMQLQSSPLPIVFKGVIPALLGNRIDAIASGMYITPERSGVIDLVPYLRVGNQVLVIKGNPLHLTGLDDMCGHRMSAPVGTVYEKSAQAQAAKCKAAGKPAMTILSLDSTAACALALKEGRADAIVASTATNAMLMHGSPDAYQTVGPTFDNNTLLGIGVSKEKAALKAAITAAVKAIVADGTYKALIAKYGLPPESSIF
jgi:polar amino acid transport system substrate-binding protein